MFVTKTRREEEATLSPWDDGPCGFDAGDANLRRVVGNDPTNATDPTGLASVPPNSESFTSAFGTWGITQTNKDDLGSGGPYSSQVKITFTPNAGQLNGNQIAFVQISRITTDGKPWTTKVNTTNRQTSAGWGVDRQAPDDALGTTPRKFGWFGYGDDGRPETIGKAGSGVILGSSVPLKPVELIDTPGDAGDPSLPLRPTRAPATFQFETYAIAKSGPDKGKVYGGISWGFSVDASARVTSLPRSMLPTPTLEFKLSVILWDLQALGPLAQRNAPDQKLLGPEINLFPTVDHQMPGLFWRSLLPPSEPGQLDIP